MTLLDGRVGGSTVYATSLVKALRAIDDLDVQVISADPGLRMSTARWMLGDAGKRLHELRADVLHSPAFFVPVNPRVPVVLTIHDLSLTRMPSGHPLEWRMYAAFLLPRLARGATMVITPTEVVRQDVIATYGIESDHVVAIHSGIDERFFALQRRREAGSSSTPVILFPGAPIARKNLDIVLRAIASASESTPLARARLEISGATAAEFPHYVRQIGDLGLTGRVAWLGRLSFDEMAAAYQRADVVVYPSFLEGFGFAPLEAMAAGIPVVSSNASCLPEVLDDAATLVDPHDDAAFGTAVNGLLSDESLRARLIVAGVARARTFTWAGAAASTAEVYQRAAARGKSAVAVD